MSAPAGSKKKGKKKGKTVNLNDFLADSGPAPGSAFVTNKSSWADEADGDNADVSAVYLDTDIPSRVQLPTAPRSAQPISLDMSKLPEQPPYTVYLGNIPFDCSEEEITMFLKKCTVSNVRIPKDNDGRFKGFCYAEVDDLDSLRTALSLNDESMRNRRIKVDLATTDNRGGPDNKYDRTQDDWRKPPADDNQDWGRGQDRGGRGGSNYDNQEWGRGREDGRGGWDRGRGGQDRRGGGYDRPAPDEESSDWRRDGPDRDDYRSGGFQDRRGGYNDSGGYSDRRGYDDRRGGYDDRRGGYDDRRGGYDDRRSGYDNRRGYGYDDRRGGGYDRRGYDDQRGGGYDDRRGGGYDRYNDRRGGGYDDRRGGLPEDRRGGYEDRRDDDRGGFRRNESNDDRGYGDRRAYGGGPREGSEGERDTGRERKKLVLTKRTQPVEPAAAPSTASGSSSIFGGAKPVDTSAREKEIEERLRREQEAAALERKRLEGDKEVNRTQRPERTRTESETSSGHEGRTRHSSSGSGRSGPRPVMIRRESERSNEEDTVFHKDDPTSPVSPTSPTEITSPRSPKSFKDEPPKVVTPAPPPKENAWARKSDSVVSPPQSSPAPQSSTSSEGAKEATSPKEQSTPHGARQSRETSHQAEDRTHRRSSGDTRSGGRPGPRRMSDPKKEKPPPKKPAEMPKYEEPKPKDWTEKNMFSGLDESED